jgi:hypothetical protein
MPKGQQRTGSLKAQFWPHAGHLSVRGAPHKDRYPRVHRPATLSVHVLGLCEGAGLAKRSHVPLDGSNGKAATSKHKAMSHEPMKEGEEKIEVGKQSPALPVTPLGMQVHNRRFGR